MTGKFHISVEAVVFIGSVMNNTGPAIGLFQFVPSLDDISVAFLFGRLHVVGMVVRDTIFEFILWVVLI